MNPIPTLGPLQYVLIPAVAVLGIALGILLPRTNIAQRRATTIFGLVCMVNFSLLHLAYMAGGGVWTRISYAFAMGLFAFAIKLLK
jgi:hypothetical protein